MDDDGLNDKLSELQSEFIRLRFQLTIRQLENHRRIPEVRKQIARIKTIQHQRNQEEVVGG
jgi:large subunit ribosomal protein L29